MPVQSISVLNIFIFTLEGYSNLQSYIFGNLSQKKILDLVKINLPGFPLTRYNEEKRVSVLIWKNTCNYPIKFIFDGLTFDREYKTMESNDVFIITNAILLFTSEVKLT